MPDFNNTEIAFQSRSSYDLRKAQMLFRSFNLPAVVTVGPKFVTTALRLHLPVTPIIKHTIFDQFCGGTTLADCEPRVAALARFGVRSILDYSVEGLGREADFDATAAEVMRIIGHVAGRADTPFAVFKVSGIARPDLLEKVSANASLSAAEKAEYARVEARFYRLCRAAAARDLRILVDAEDSWYQPALDALCLAMMRELNRERPLVYNTLQMYRTDRLALLKDLHATGKREGFKPGFKLVRGAYMEKERERAAQRGYPSPIHGTKAATDRDYDLALEYCLANIDDLAVFSGTHNEQSNHLLARLMERRGLARNDPRVDFSQLLGMSDNQTFNLAHHGYNVSKYVPYGPVRAVLPYLFRRMEENSAIKGQVGRELQLIERELSRRATVH